MSRKDKLERLRGLGMDAVVRANGEGTSEDDRAYEPAAITSDELKAVDPIAPITAYVIERDGPGWRASAYEVHPTVLVRYGRRKWTHEPDLKGLALDQVVRDFELREK